MKTPTSILQDEHQYILKGIAALVKESKEVQKGKAIDKKFYNEIIDFIRNYADKFHHAKEEDILFKELCSDEVHMHCNPVGQMLHEHDVGRQYVKGMEDAVKANDREMLVENSLGYASLLQDHIFKEDNILYPMADQALNDRINKSMMERFTAAEEKLGKGFGKKYEDMITSFGVKL